MNATMDEMVKHRVLPLIERSKIRPFLLEDYIQNGETLSDISVHNIKEDLQIALQYLQTHHYKFGPDITANRVLLDRVCIIPNGIMC